MIALLLALALNARAETLVSMESLMDRPMESRVREFARLGIKAQPFLSRTAFDKSQSLQTRWRAITTMGRLDPLTYRPELDRALRSPEWFMRNAALIALKSDDRTRAIAWSTSLLNDRALVVRSQAVRNLIELDARESEHLLWKYLTSSQNFRGKQSLWIRADIAEALARFGAPNRTRHFQALLNDPDERVHKWAVVGLENSTGMKLGAAGEDIEMRRQKWISRLGGDSI